MSDLLRIKQLCDAHLQWLLDNTESIREMVLLCEATSSALRGGIEQCGLVVTEKTGQA